MLIISIYNHIINANLLISIVSSHIISFLSSFVNISGILQYISFPLYSFHKKEPQPHIQPKSFLLHHFTHSLSHLRLNAFKPFLLSWRTSYHKSPPADFYTQNLRHATRHKYSFHTLSLHINSSNATLYFSESLFSLTT